MQQSADIETWQQRLGNVSEGLGTLASSVKQLMLPADEVAARVDAELVKLEKTDQAYAQLKEKVADIDLAVTDLKGSLQSTQSHAGPGRAGLGCRSPNPRDP